MKKIEETENTSIKNQEDNKNNKNNKNNKTQVSKKIQCNKEINIKHLKIFKIELMNKENTPLRQLKCQTKNY